MSWYIKYKRHFRNGETKDETVPHYQWLIEHLRYGSMEGKIETLISVVTLLCEVGLEKGILSIVDLADRMPGNDSDHELVETK